MAPKASVDKGTTIRAASRNKQRSQTSNKAAASPFGSSAGGSLASSLSSLFSPQPHGKDAALASLLASSSKPPVNLGQKSGLAAFGSFSSAKPAGSVTAPTSAAAGPSRLFDDKQKTSARMQRQIMTERLLHLQAEAMQQRRPAKMKPAPQLQKCKIRRKPRPLSMLPRQPQPPNQSYQMFPLAERLSSDPFSQAQQPSRGLRCP